MAWGYKRYFSARGFGGNLVFFFLISTLLLLYLWFSKNSNFFIWFLLVAAFFIIILIFYIQQNIKLALIRMFLFILKKTILYKYAKSFFVNSGLGKIYSQKQLGNNDKNLGKEKILKEISQGHWMGLSLGILGDSLYILRHYLHQKKEKIARRDNSLPSMLLRNLSCSDFENLLYRLNEAMGYAVQITRKINDQTFYLIASKNSQVKLLIYAKCYDGSPVENSDIQEAVAAQKLHECNTAIVVTSSDFTKEATELAKVNMVGLVGKERLCELLLQNLKERWN